MYHITNNAFPHLLSTLDLHMLRETLVSTRMVSLSDLLEQVACEFKRTLSSRALSNLNGRLERGLALAKNASVIPISDSQHPRRFKVRSSDGTQFYQVDLDEHTCECPDSQKGNTCKHRIAAYFVEQAEMLKQQVDQTRPQQHQRPAALRTTCSVPPTQEVKYSPTCSVPPKRADFEKAEIQRKPEVPAADKATQSEERILTKEGSEPGIPKILEPKPLLGTLYRRYLRGSDLGGQSYKVTIENIIKEVVLPHPAMQPIEKWCLIVSGLPLGLPNRILFGARGEEDLCAIFGSVGLEEVKDQSMVIYPKPTRVAGSTKLAIRFRRAE